MRPHNYTPLPTADHKTYVSGYHRNKDGHYIPYHQLSCEHLMNAIAHLCRALRRQKPRHLSYFLFSSALRADTKGIGSLIRHAEYRHPGAYEYFGRYWEELGGDQFS